MKNVLPFFISPGLRTKLQNRTVVGVEEIVTPFSPANRQTDHTFISDGYVDNDSRQTSVGDKGGLIASWRLDGKLQLDNVLPDTGLTVDLRPHPRYRLGVCALVGESDGAGQPLVDQVHPAAVKLCGHHNLGNSHLIGIAWVKGHENSI